MTRWATLIPSPMMLAWPLMSLTSRAGPRLPPTRICRRGPLVVFCAPTASRRLMPANRVSSGSPRKLTAAPSPVSRMMRSSVGTPTMASVRTALKRSLSAICSATERCEYSTMSRNSTLQIKVRLVCSGIFVRRGRLPPRPGAARVLLGGDHSTAPGLRGHPKVARISTHCQPVLQKHVALHASTMSITQEQVHAVLKEALDPNTGKDFFTTKSARNVRVEGGNVSLEIELGYPAKTQIDPIRKLVGQKLRALPGVGSVNVEVTSRIISHSVQRGVKLVPGVKNIIAVASGKGGVGKSTTAVNLALGFAAEGASVGILDADIYGPSQPMMLGIAGRPESKDGKTLEPMVGHGIQAISIGFLIDIDTPMVWRGPMVTQALEQLLKDTNWRDLDYLIVDMPPGTGDIQLTLAQKVPVTGAVIVTTPQDIALIDARKGLKMFEKVGVPIIGIVENMSTHICSNCGHAEAIFGEGGAKKMCDDYDVPFLGQLPLDIHIREQADSGRPTVVADPDGAIARIYKDIARKTAVFVAQKAEDFSAKFPNIVVQNT